MRRKFLAVLLVVALMFSSVVPSFAVASVDQGDGGSDVVFWIEDVTVEPGATEAKVKLHVSGGADKWATAVLFVGTPEGVLSTSYAAGDYIDDPAKDFDLFDFGSNADAAAIGAYNNSTTRAELDFSGSAVWNHIVTGYRDGNSNDNYPGAEGVIVEFTYSLPAADDIAYPVELLVDAVYDINGQAVSYKALGGEIKVPAPVAPADPVKLSADIKTVEQYDEFTYSVNVDENPGFWGMSFNIGFDASALELVGVSSSVFAVDEETVTEREDGTLGIVLENSEFADVTATGSIIDFTFKAKTLGEFPVTISFTDAGNVVTADEKVVPVEFTSGSVNVVECSHSVTHVEKIEPTATEDGVYIVICDKCGNEDRTIIPSVKEATISAAVVTVEKGDEFEYAITLDTATFGVWGLHFDVKFDTTALELLGVESDNFIVDDSSVVVTADGIKLTLDRDTFENVLAPATVVVLKFKAVAEGAFDVNLSAADGDVVDVDENAIAVSFVNGVVNVDPCSHPSITEDRKEPTDDEDGYIRYICDKCGHVDEVILPHEKLATITGQTVTVENGDEFDYAISLTSTTCGVWGLHFDVKFDTSAVKYVGFTAGAGFNSDDVTVVTTADGLKVTLDRDELENVTDLGALITLKFKAVAEGTYEVALSAEEGNIIIADEKVVDTTFENGTITVTACTHGAGTRIDRKEPTETEDGYERVICDKCGETIFEETLYSARKATISAETKTVENGDEFEYVINLDSTTRGVWGLHFDVKFDTSAVKYVGFTAGAGFNSDDVTVVTTADGLKVTLDREELENITEPGALITLKFKAAAEGTVDVALSAEEGNIIGVDEKPVETTFESGTITVTACTHGAGTHIDRVEPTEAEDGSEKVICDKCGETISEKVLLGVRKATISAETKTVENGDEFEYVINLDSTNRGVWGLHFDVKFDTSVVKYVGFTAGAGFNSDDVTVVATADGLKVTLDREELENITEPGALITLKFKAAAEGTVDVALSAEDGNIIGVDEIPVDTTFVNGTITVTACTHGAGTHIDRVEPTEIESGYEKVICDKCGKTVSETVLPATGKVIISAETKTVEFCDEFDYVVSLDFTNHAVYSAWFDVKFDSTVLEYVDFESNLPSGVDSIAINVKDYGLFIAITNRPPEDITVDSVLITLKFKAVAEGSTDMTVFVPERGLIDADENVIDTYVVNGSVTVTECSHSNTHIDRVEPTETQNGSEKVVCDKCGDTVSETVLPATGKVTISAEDKTVDLGDEFDYVISLDSTIRGVWGVKFDVKFDSTVLEYVGFESNLFNSGDVTVIVDENGLKITINNSALENITADSALITLKFKAVAEGSTDITVIVPEDGVVNVEEEIIGADVVNGSVTVAECIHPSTHIERVAPTETEYGYVIEVCDKCGKVIGKHHLVGDAELDGDVDGTDICLIMRHEVGMLEFNEDQLNAADADRNGKITARDLLLIKLHIVGLTELGYLD